jgi:tRNA-splicing ligase RtcB
MNAPVRVHTDARLTRHFDASPLRPVIDQVAALPTVESVDVFADIAPKTLGIPSGVVLTTAGPDPMLYPTAVTDIACGFAVIATGIDPSQWDQARRRQIFDDMCTAVAVTSPARTPPAIDIEAVLTTGLEALPPPGRYSHGPGTDQPASLLGDPALFDGQMRRLLAEHAGSVAGHFIALYTAEPFPRAPTSLVHGELVLVVHTGAPAIRAWAYQHLFTPIAERCLALHLVEPHLVGEHQLFGLPLRDPLSQTFLRMAATAVLYGYATRHLTTETILNVLDRHHPARMTDPRLIRHNGHGWYEHQPQRIRSGRGIQTLTPPQQALIVGGDRTHAYLFQAGHHSNGLLSHGVPMWTHPHQTAPALLPDPRTLPANTSPNPDTWREAALNLELVRTSLETTGHATPTVRLMPWANYKETHVDAVTRPRS